VNACCVGAIQTKQAFHDVNLNNPNRNSAPIAPQFDAAALDDGNDSTVAIDTGDPVWHERHQAGEFLAELRIHGFDT
jgi:hypothetical protein